jgi:shikimate kinase
MAHPLILIGPMHAGKSTVARLLAERFGVRRICMDHVRFDYYKEIGYDEKHADELAKQQGFGAKVAYWKPFEAHAVERLLVDHAGEKCVIDFGAGHSVYDDPVLFARVKTALRPFPVVLLLPSPDPKESVDICAKRGGSNPKTQAELIRVNDHFVRHPSNALLAKFTVYNADHTPEQTADDVAQAIAGAW